MENSELWAAAREYASWGWSVFPLCPVDLSAGRCACGETNPAQVGKHPARGVMWRTESTNELDQVDAWWTENHLYGVAIDCGKSGVLALDIDVKGDINGWVAAGEFLGGPMVSTPTGGAHIFFALPEEPHDLTVDNTGKVGRGVDLRGRGGYVVAAPTRTPRGQYVWVVGHGASLPPTPAAVIERMRAARTDDIVPTERIARPVPTGYVGSALEGCARDYLNAPRGHGETAGIAALCRLFELWNAPWSDFDLEAGHDVLDGARRARRETLAGSGGGQTDRDWQRMVRSARRRVGDRCAPYPSQLAGLKVNGVEVSAPAARLDTGSRVVPNPERPQSDQSTDGDELSALHAQMMNAKGVDLMPEPVWLVQDWLEANSTASLIGASGSMKSFVALDLACHISSTFPTWHGHVLENGEAWYMAAEGATGIAMRLRAWMREYATEPAGLRVLGRPIQITSREWDTWVALAARERPKLVILDTQARITVGLEENSAKEMGVLIDRVEDLRAASGACVLLVHHTGKAGMAAGGRGSSALYAAWTSELSVERDRAAGIVRVSSSKEKDASDETVLEFRPKIIEVGKDNFGDPQTSIVLDPITDTQRMLGRQTVLSVAKHSIMTVINELFPRDETTTRAKVRMLVEARGVPKTSFYRAWTEMVETGVLEKVGATTVNPSYRVTEIGERIMSQQDSQTSPNGTDVDGNGKQQ